jgi:hypothetical protein
VKKFPFLSPLYDSTQNHPHIPKEKLILKKHHFLSKLIKSDGIRIIEYQMMMALCQK